MCGNIIEAAGTNSNIRRFLQAGCLCPKPCIPAYGAKRSTGPLSALAAGHFSFIRMYGIYQWRSRGTKSKSRRFCSAGCPIPKPCVRSCPESHWPAALTSCSGLFCQEALAYMS